MHSLKTLFPSLASIYHQHEQKSNPLKTGGYVAIEAIEKSEDEEDEKLNRIIAIIEEAKVAGLFARRYGNTRKRE
jgi:hypothetical protein